MDSEPQVCARSACDSHDVRFVHRHDGRKYCPRCARKINEAVQGQPVCLLPVGTEALVTAHIVSASDDAHPEMTCAYPGDTVVVIEHRSGDYPYAVRHTSREEGTFLVAFNEIRPV